MSHIQNAANLINEFSEANDVISKNFVQLSILLLCVCVWPLCWSDTSRKSLIMTLLLYFETVPDREDVTISQCLSSLVCWKIPEVFYLCFWIFKKYLLISWANHDQRLTKQGSFLRQLPVFCISLNFDQKSKCRSIYFQTIVFFLTH